MLLAVDPGDEYTGCAEFRGQECSTTYTLDPERYQDQLHRLLLLGLVDAIVLERWALDPNRAKQLSGSELMAVQLVGVTRYLARRYDIELHISSTSNKRARKPIEAQLRQRGLQLIGQNTHERDAELHGYRHLMTTRTTA